MSVTFAEVLGALEQEGIPAVVRSTDGPESYSDCSNLFSAYDPYPDISQERYTAGVLYLGSIDDFNPKTVTAGSGFVFFGTVPSTFSHVIGCDVAAVPNAYKDRARQAIYDLFYASVEMQAYRKLASHISETQGIQGVVDLFSSILQNPIVVCDPLYFEWAVFSRPYETNVRDLSSILNYQMIPEDYRDIALGKDSAYKFFESNTAEYVTEGAYETNPRIAQAIAVDGRVVGSVTLVEGNRPLDHADMATVQLLTQILAEEIRRNGVPRDATRERRLHDLLKGDRSQLDFFAEWANDSASEKASRLRLIIAWRDGMKAHHLNEELKRAFCGSRNCISTVVDDAAVLVAVLPDSREEAAFVGRAHDWLRERNCRAIVSETVLDIESMHEIYEAMRQIATFGDVGDAGSQIVDFGDAAPFGLIRQAACNASIRPYLMPGLLLLKRYDEENGTAYFETLVAYAKTGSRSKAATSLFIHKNTLNYRLERIAELLGLQSIDDISVYRVLLTVDMLLYLASSADADDGNADDGDSGSGDSNN